MESEASGAAASGTASIWQNTLFGMQHTVLGIDPAPSSVILLFIKLAYVCIHH